MAVDVHGRIRIHADGIWLGGEHEEPFSTASGGVRFEFSPSSEPDDCSTAVTATAVFTTPDDVGQRLASQWPQLVEDVRAFWSAHDAPVAHRRLPFGPALRFLFQPEPEVDAFFVSARRDLRASVRRLLGLLSWYFNVPLLPGSENRSNPTPIEWSLNGDEWIRDISGLPRTFAAADFGDAYAWEVVGAQDVLQQALDRYGHEPIAHELIAEAVRLGEESPRSALVVAMTAAEVAVRSFVGSRGRADAAWLLSRPQAPPLDELLKNYLPFITDVRTRKGAVIPSELRRLIRRGVESRNKIVHYGEPGPDEAELAQLLTAVNDVLYILDWLSGEEWAIDRVSGHWKDEYETKTEPH